MKSRGNALVGTSFCVANEAASVLPKKKDYEIQKILKDINFIPHLSYLSHILEVMNHCYCYLQGRGCNIVDFAIKLTILGVGKVRLASLKRLFDPRLVVFQLFVRNTEDLFCFVFAIAFFVLHPHCLLLCGRILVFAFSSLICISCEVEDFFFAL